MCASLIEEYRTLIYNPNPTSSTINRTIEILTISYGDKDLYCSIRALDFIRAQELQPLSVQGIMDYQHIRDEILRRIDTWQHSGIY